MKNTNFVVSHNNEDMSLDEAKRAMETVANRLDPDANVIWGTQIAPDLKNTIRTLLVITGVHSPQIFGGKETFSIKRKQMLSDDLGIDFIEG